MDYQNRAGSKFGGGGVAGHSATNADRRERLRKLALETIDLDKDPYFFKNHVGSFECRLCLTVHQNDGSYLAHTQGKKAPDQPSAACGQGAEGRQGQGRGPGDGPALRRRGRRLRRPGAGRHAAQRGAHRPPRLQDHQDPRPRHAPARPALPAAVPGHRPGHRAQRGRS